MSVPGPTAGVGCSDRYRFGHHGRGGRRPPESQLFPAPAAVSFTGYGVATSSRRPEPHSDSGREPLAQLYGRQANLVGQRSGHRTDLKDASRYLQHQERNRTPRSVGGSHEHHKDLGTLCDREKPSPLEYQFLDANGAVIQHHWVHREVQLHRARRDSGDRQCLCPDGYGRQRRGTPSPGTSSPRPVATGPRFIVGNGTNRYESVEDQFRRLDRCRNHAEHLRWIMANASVSITPGAGAQIDAHQIGSGDYQQIIRTAKVDTRNINDWAVSTTAAAVISADENRVGCSCTTRARSGSISRSTMLRPSRRATLTGTWIPGTGGKFLIRSGQMAMSFLAASAGQEH